MKNANEDVRELRRQLKITENKLADREKPNRDEILALVGEIDEHLDEVEECLADTTGT